MTKVSVIIPVYGVEKYIERCARSLFEQTLDEIEYIFVNDCTKDESITVLKKVILDYPNRKDQVIILNHETNKGLPQARRTGVLESKGVYITHCDSDDWVDRDMYETMYNYAMSGSYDIVTSGYYLSDGKVDIPITMTKKRRRLIQGPIWINMVKRDIYINNEIIYPVANKAEDGALMTQLSYYASSMGCIPKPFYHYYMNQDSMTRTLSEEECLKRLEQEKENTNLRISFLESHNEKDNFKSDIILWKWYTRNNLLPLFGKKNFYGQWLKTYPEINVQLFLDRKVSFRTKFTFLLQLFRLYSIAKKLYLYRNRISYRIAGTK